MIERAFNRMKMKMAHDRERERIRAEIIDKRNTERLTREYDVSI